MNLTPSFSSSDLFAALPWRLPPVRHPCTFCPAISLQAHLKVPFVKYRQDLEVYPEIQGAHISWTFCYSNDLFSSLSSTLDCIFHLNLKNYDPLCCTSPSIMSPTTTHLEAATLRLWCPTNSTKSKMPSGHISDSCWLVAQAADMWKCVNIRMVLQWGACVPSHVSLDNWLKVKPRKLDAYRLQYNYSNSPGVTFTLLSKPRKSVWSKGCAHHYDWLHFHCFRQMIVDLCRFSFSFFSFFLVGGTGRDWWF